jgi:CRP-like cAMP-binding protein
MLEKLAHYDDKAAADDRWIPGDAGNPHSNALLAALVDAGAGRLRARAELVHLKAGEVLYESDRKIRHVYFPTTAIASVVHMMEDGATIEMAVVGAEGIIGVPLFMGGETPLSRAVVHGAGEALRAGASLLLEEFNASMAAQRLLLRYTQSLLLQISQTIACSRRHSVQQQLCRWLLSSLDRAPCNDLKITHESIAGMLGVRRESVSREVAILQAANVIHQGWGRITVVDRRELEVRACDCYRGRKNAVRAAVYGGLAITPGSAALAPHVRMPAPSREQRPAAA